METRAVKLEATLTPTQIKTLRRNLGLTQYAFAELLKVRVTTVSRWECGQRTPHNATLSEIVKAANRGAMVRKKG